MLSDLDSGEEGGDLIYKPGFMPKGRDRFTHLVLISVYSLLSINHNDTRGES
jgi:hypothetical protein